MVGRKSSERKTFPSKSSTLSKLEDIQSRERCGTTLYRILGFQTDTLQDQERYGGSGCLASGITPLPFPQGVQICGVESGVASCLF